MRLRYEHWLDKKDIPIVREKGTRITPVPQTWEALMEAVRTLNLPPLSSLIDIYQYVGTDDEYDVDECIMLIDSKELYTDTLRSKDFSSHLYVVTFEAAGWEFTKND